MQYFADVSQYMPHGMCLLWQPWLIALWAGSDLLIFLSYSAIPLALLTVLRKRRDVPHAGLVSLFASFILLCGLTHLFGIVTLWYPIYPWVGLLKLVTGIVSMITAVVLFRLIPRLIALPSPRELEHSNSQLKEEVAAHQATLASLEEQVATRTAELSRANATLAVQAREAVHRSSNLLAVVGSMAKQAALSETDIGAYVANLQGRIQALASATATVMRGGDSASESLETVLREQLEPLLSDMEARLTIAGPELRIGSEAAQQIALALHELATNSRKYGVAGGDAGTIALTWEILRQDDEPTLQLEWCERGPDIAEPTPSAREGFGSKLLIRVVPAMLKGSASRELKAGVFAYRLAVPLGAVEREREQPQEASFAAEIVDRTFGLA